MRSLGVIHYDGRDGHQTGGKIVIRCLIGDLCINMRAGDACRMTWLPDMTFPHRLSACLSDLTTDRSLSEHCVHSLSDPLPFGPNVHGLTGISATHV